jgi:hypothetical protein
MILLLCLLLGIALIILIAVNTLSVYRQGSLVYLFGSTLPLVQLSLYYFVFPIGIIFGIGQSNIEQYGIAFSQTDILFVLSLSFVIGLAYLFGFRIGFGTPRKERQWSRLVSPSRQKALWYLFIVLVVVDSFYRIDAIISGTYFSWMRKYTIEEGVTDTFTVFITSFTPLAAALAVYFSSRNRLCLVYLAFLLVLVLLEGSRTSLVLVFFSCCATYVLYNGFRGGLAKKSRWVFAASVVLGLALAIVLDVRRDFRANTNYALDNPVAFIVDSTAKNVLNRLGIVESRGAAIELSGAELSERSIVHLTTFATITNRYLAGYPLLPFSNFIEDTKRAIPSAIIGKKSGYSAGNAVGLHFSFRTTNARGHFDPGSTAYQAIFAIFGPLGSIGLALFVGLAFGFLFRFISTRYSRHAWVLAVGLVDLLIIDGNNYSAILTNIRHLLVLLVFLEFLTFVAKAGGSRVPARRPKRTPIFPWQAARPAPQDLH